MADAVQRQSNHHLLTIREAASESRFSQSYIRKQIREGHLKQRRFGDAKQAPVRIERDEFDRWIKTRPRKIVVSQNGVSATNTVAPDSERVEVF